MVETIHIEPRKQLSNWEPNFDTKSEPVYALMITGKDRFHSFLAHNAILSFIAQSYEAARDQGASDRHRRANKSIRLAPPESLDFD